MPTIYAADTDGYLYNYTTDTWVNVRGAGTATHAGASVTRYSRAIRTFHTAGRGGDTYFVGRSFFAFDTSGITATVASATLKIYGFSNDDAGGVIAVKATAPDLSTDIAVADFDAITGFSAGNTMSGNVTDYSSELATWTTSGYNEITLNAQALSDMVSGDVLKICVVEHDHDYSNSAPSNADFDNGCYFSEYSSTSRDPYIDYTLAAGAQVAKVSGVAEASISTVSGVANASIASIIDGDMP